MLNKQGKAPAVRAFGSCAQLYFLPYTTYRLAAALVEQAAPYPTSDIR